MDEAPASSYKVNQLILRKHPNDEHALVRKIDQENYEQSLQEAITALQNKYLEKKENADSFLQYLSGLTDAQRSNGYLMSKQMKAYNL